MKQGMHIGSMMPEHDPVYKVTIIPRGRALGVTMFLPEEDTYMQSKEYLLGRIATYTGKKITFDQAQRWCDYGSIQ